MTDMKFERRAAMATLLADRPDNLFVVPGLGSCTWDAFAAGDSDRTFYLWGAMGGAAMIGLGLALAQPKLRVAVITGDGEMLMGIGSLATIGVQQPPNLSVVVFDVVTCITCVWFAALLSERRSTLEALRASQRRFRCIFEHNIIPTVIWRDNMRGARSPKPGIGWCP